MLPSGYTLLEYIKNSGAQYIDTGFIPNQNTRMVIDCEITYASGWAMLAGTHSNSERFSWWSDRKNIEGNYIASAKKTAGFTGRGVLDANKNVWFVNGSTLTFTQSNFTSAKTIYLFSVNGGSGVPNGTMKLYSCQIYDNGTLVRQFVPCINPDGEVGLYDLVGRKFYGNTGTGVFTAGSELFPARWIRSTGQQHIDTGFKPNQDTRVVADIQIVKIDGYAPLFGSRVASKNAEYATWAITESTIQDGYGTSVDANLSANWLARQIVDKNKNAFYVDGVQIKAHTTQTFAPNYSLFLFNINTAGSTTGSFKTYAKMYSCQIYDNGTLVRDYIPMVDAKDVGGLYDRVTLRASALKPCQN